jgi:hypothetical protein
LWIERPISENVAERAVDFSDKAINGRLLVVPTQGVFSPEKALVGE